MTADTSSRLITVVCPNCYAWRSGHEMPLVIPAEGTEPIGVSWILTCGCVYADRDGWLLRPAVAGGGPSDPYIRCLARAASVPPEMILDQQESTHWTAWAPDSFPVDPEDYFFDPWYVHPVGPDGRIPSSYVLTRREEATVWQTGAAAARCPVCRDGTAGDVTYPEPGPYYTIIDAEGREVGWRTISPDTGTECHIVWAAGTYSTGFWLTGSGTEFSRIAPGKQPACPWFWGSHACDLAAGHRTPHSCQDFVVDDKGETYIEVCCVVTLDGYYPDGRWVRLVARN